MLHLDFTMVHTARHCHNALNHSTEQANLSRAAHLKTPRLRSPPPSCEEEKDASDQQRTRGANKLLCSAHILQTLLKET